MATALISTFGEEQARLYYEANEGALRFIRELVRDHSIDCQLTEEAAYVYGHSFRSVMHNDEQLVIVGGGGHKTGQGGCTLSYYEQLEQYAGGLLGIRNILFRWSAQDLITLDSVPYIGQIAEDKENIWVATGFAKWGIPR